MIYLQHSAAEAAAARTIMDFPAGGLLSFYFSAEAAAVMEASAVSEEMTAAALSGF